MSGRLSVALILMVLLGACGGFTRTVPVTRVTVETCPPQPPDSDCPAFPTRGQTLRELLHAWQDAAVAHARCRAAVTVWEQAWDACQDK